MSGVLRERGRGKEEEVEWGSKRLRGGRVRERGEWMERKWRVRYCEGSREGGGGRRTGRGRRRKWRGGMEEWVERKRERYREGSGGGGKGGEKGGEMGSLYGEVRGRGRWMGKVEEED